MSNIDAPSITLSRSEFEILSLIGKFRNETTSSVIGDRKQDKNLDSLQMNIDGCLSEYAVAKILNLNFSLDCSFKKEFPADLVTRKGTKIDVKSTRTINGAMNLPLWTKNKSAEIFISTQIGANWISLEGWITKEEALDERYLKNVGNGKFYSVPRTDLYKFDEETIKGILR